MATEESSGVGVGDYDDFAPNPNGETGAMSTSQIMGKRSEDWTVNDTAQFFASRGEKKLADRLRSEEMTISQLYEALNDEDLSATDIKEALGINKLKLKAVKKLVNSIDDPVECKDVLQGARRKIKFFESTIRSEIVTQQNHCMKWDSASEKSLVSVRRGVLGVDYQRVVDSVLNSFSGLKSSELERVYVAKCAEQAGDFMVEQAYNQPIPHRGKLTGKCKASYFVFYLKRKGDPDLSQTGDARFDNCKYDISIVAYQCDYQMQGITVKHTSSKSWIWGLFHTSSTWTTREWSALDDKERKALEIHFKTRAISQWRSSGFIGAADQDKIYGTGLQQIGEIKKDDTQ